MPELAGLVRAGHAERVADLSVDLGRELHLSAQDLDYLRAAALLHHLGHLCLDDPEVRGRPIEPSEVTDKGAEILRQTEYLRPAGDLLASDTASVGSQILRVASAYDELTAGDPAFSDAAIEALYSGPGYVYDPRVLDALERVAGSAAKVPSRSVARVAAASSPSRCTRGEVDLVVVVVSSSAGRYPGASGGADGWPGR